MRPRGLWRRCRQRRQAKRTDIPIRTGLAPLGNFEWGILLGSTVTSGCPNTVTVGCNKRISNHRSLRNSTSFAAAITGNVVFGSWPGVCNDCIKLHVFDLDIQAKALCEELGVPMVRSATVGTHARFVRIIRELICERLDPSAPRMAWGDPPARPDFCPVDCCLPGALPVGR